jgi:OmpA-OmpF porin, OOP family
MARNCFLLLLILNSTLSFAQIKIGIIGGPQSTSVTEKNDIPQWDTTTGKFYTNKSSFHIGMMAQIPLGQDSRFYFQPSVLYSQKGRNYLKYYEINNDDSTYTYYNNQTLDIQYIDVPLNILYKLPLSHKKNANFLLSAGPYISLFYNGKKTVTQRESLISSDTLKNKKTFINTSEELQVGKKDNSYKILGYGINARAGFEIGKVTLTGFFSQGLDNFYYATYSGTFKHKVFGASLGIWLGSINEPVIVKDKDHDGIPDDKDACPLLPGTAITNGCPDKDGDGIPDNKDKCIDIAGTVKYNGCPIPDSDKDGINDEEDKCPHVVGTVKYNGCPVPDTDKDGINDEEDKCPNLAGLPKYNGCPIPDSDNDGVNDEEDKCPNIAGEAVNNGCPVTKEEITKQVDFAAENIFFSYNSIELLAKSYQPLNVVVEILKKNPALKLSVNGYTDNTGSPSANQLISQKRALAVKNYLVKNGIEESRIFVRGYGQNNPIADNKTALGRTKNRRVELKLKD